MKKKRSTLSKEQFPALSREQRRKAYRLLAKKMKKEKTENDHQ